MPELDGRRVLITEAERFMGPALGARFAEAGATVIADRRDLRPAEAAAAAVADAGTVDVLVVNLGAINPRTLAHQTSDAAFAEMYEVMVYPLHRLVRAVLPQMLERRRGKIVVMGSASALRFQGQWSAYASARGAQLTYVQSVGAEVAAHNVQVNAIAQTFVDNPVYFSAEYQKTEEFRRRLAQVPAGRLASGREDAELALFLASGRSDFICGQVIPFAGGWVV